MSVDIQAAKANFPAFNANMLKFAPWSHSKISKLDKCPLNFAASYLFKLPEGSYEPVRSSAQQEGIAAHILLEEMLKLLNEGLVIGDFDKFFSERYDILLTKVIKDLGLLQEEIDQLTLSKDMMIMFIAKVDKIFQAYPKSVMLIEGKMAIDQDFNPCAFDTDYSIPRENQAIFRGLYDLCLVNPGDKMLLVDHKAANYRPGRVYPSIMKQFGTYLAMLALQFPEALSDLKMFSAKMNIVKHGVLSDAGKYRLPYVLDTLIPNLVNESNETANKLNGNVIEKVPNNHCKWCEFRLACKHEKNLQRLLVDQGKAKFPGAQLIDVKGDIDKCKGEAKLGSKED